MVSGLRGSRSAAIPPEPRHSCRAPPVRYARFCDWNLYHVLREIPILRQIFDTVIPEASIASMRSELSRITCIFTSLPGRPSQPHSLGPLQSQGLLRAHRNQITFDLSHETECET